MDDDLSATALGPLLIELGPRVSHLVRHALKRVEPSLSYAQFRVLLHIGEGRDTLSALRSPATLALSTLSEIVDGLVQRDLVVRTPSERDRRAVELTLTDAGGRVLSEARQRLDALAERLTAGVSPAARAWLAETIAPINAAAQEALVEGHARGGHPAPDDTRA